MLSLNQIQEYYPENLRPFKKNLLREYLQYKILEIIFDSPFANKLSFLGGTALRIVYDNSRFSEDLDFDNFDLKESEFFILTKFLQGELEKQGFLVEMRNVYKGVFRCYIKLPKILFENSLSNMEAEKIVIQVDTAAHNFFYEPENKILNKFDVFTQIKTTPLDILLSQKIYAIFNRKRPKGRDFFDVVFLLGKIRPNYKYLDEKINIKDAQNLRDELEKYIKKLDIDDLVKEVEPFLFYPSDSKKIRMFGEYLREVEL